MKIAQNLPSAIFIILIENVNHRFSHSGVGAWMGGAPPLSYNLFWKPPPIKIDAPPLRKEPPHLKNKPPHWKVKHPSMKRFLEKAHYIIA